MKCPVMKAFNQLKRFAGFPVPDIVEWVDGKPDFRKIDHQKFVHHYQHRLCAVCGHKLTASCYWVGGPLSANGHYFTDGPMHRECVEESIKVCPFLNKNKTTYRGELPHNSLQIVDGRPERMYLMRGRTSDYRLIVLATGHSLWAGKELVVVKEF
jgi:hypothetical protein